MKKQNRIDFALRSQELFENKKIIVRKTGDKLIASLDFENYYFDTLVHGIYEISNINSLESLLAILNSKPVTFFYRILHDIKGKVFAKISLDNLSSFPIPKIDENYNESLSNLTLQMLSLKKEFQESSLKFQRTIQRKFEIDKLPKKLQDWYLLTYGEFIKELGKKKIKLSLYEESEWEDFFISESKKIIEIKDLIDKTDKEIDTMVYQLYDLTEKEIEIIESSF